jgi:hypothetical protein
MPTWSHPRESRGGDCVPCTKYVTQSQDRIKECGPSPQRKVAGVEVGGAGQFSCSTGARTAHIKEVSKCVKQESSQRGTAMIKAPLRNTLAIARARKGDTKVHLHTYTQWITTCARPPTRVKKEGRRTEMGGVEQSGGGEEEGRGGMSPPHGSVAIMESRDTHAKTWTRRHPPLSSEGGRWIMA